MADFVIKQDDTLPALVATLRDANGVLNLSSGVSGVKFIMRSTQNNTVKVNAACTVTNGAGGVVQYDWIAADTDTAGTFDGEWQVTYTNGKKLSCPNDSYKSIEVKADLGD